MSPSNLAATVMPITLLVTSPGYLARMTIPGFRDLAFLACRTGAVLGLLGLGCTTDSCGCSPAPSSLLFYGRVVAGGGQPIRAAAIVVTLTSPDCSVVPGASTTVVTVSDGDGRFRTPPSQAETGAQVCVAIAAYQGSATGPLIAKVEGLLIRYPATAGGVDSLGVLLRAVAAVPWDGSRDTAAFFQTDSLDYTLRTGSLGYSAVIGAAFSNRSSATAFIVNCAGATQVALEKLIDDQWLPVWLAINPLCLSSPITVPKDGSYRTQINIFGGYPGTNTQPKFTIVDPSGVYRAVWGDVLSSYEPTSPFGEPLPLAARTSNRFRLTVGPGGN